MNKTILVFMGILFLQSCMKSDLPEFNKIEKPRVMTLIANLPEANPGDSVTITPVISDLNASVLKDSAQVCLDLGIAFGAEPTCDNNPTKIVLHSERTLVLPGLSEQWTGLADSFIFSIPVENTIFNLKSSKEKFNGVNYLVEYTLHTSTGENIKTLKRIVVSESIKTSKNSNPLATQIYSDGVLLITLPINTAVSLTTDVGSSSVENYELKSNDSTIKNYTEEITTTWFITDGETEYSRSVFQSANKYTGPSILPSGRSSYLLAIVKDNRGGVTVVKKKMN